CPVLGSFSVTSICAASSGWSCQNPEYGSRLWLVKRTHACTSQPIFLPYSTATFSGSNFLARSIYDCQPALDSCCLHQRCSSASVQRAPDSTGSTALSRWLP